MDIEITIDQETIRELICDELETRGFKVDAQDVKFIAKKVYEDRPCGNSTAIFQECKVKVKL